MLCLCSLSFSICNCLTVVSMKFFSFRLHSFQTSHASSAGIPQIMISAFPSWRFVLNNKSLKDFNDYQNKPTFIRVTKCAEALTDFQSGIRCQLLNFLPIKVVHVTLSWTINLLV